MYKNFFKRLIDIIVSGSVLLILLLPLGIITLWLHFVNKGAGAFFIQERPGRDGKIFRLIKYKSMTDERDQEGKLLPDDKRLTRVGRFVRASSIDEIPQLWNVLKGDMSLIGPRPLLPQYLQWYTSEEKHRHDVRPGITGYAQTHGRNKVTWEDKLSMDVFYVKNLSFGLDMKILFSTIGKVVKGSDIEVAYTEEPFDEYRKKKLFEVSK